MEEIDKIKEIIDEKIVDKISVEIKDDDELDKSIQKPKKERSEKQKEAFKKARETRANNFKKRQEELLKNKKPVGRPKKEIIDDKEIINKELIEEYEKENQNINPSMNGFCEDNIESSSEEEIIYMKKPKTKKPIKKPKKKKPKKKIVYVSESSSESDSSSEEEEMEYKILKPKKKKVYYDDEIDYNKYKPISLTDFYKVI